MRSTRRTRIIAMMLASVLIAGCKTTPAKLVLAPELTEDDNVRITYRIGTEIYFLAITNKTASEMTIDLSRCSVISVGGQTRTLSPKPEDSHIPPESTLIIRSTQATFFHTDIDDMFRLWPIADSGKKESEKEYLRRFLGKEIRLFLPISILGTERVYDLKLIVKDVAQE